MPNRVGKLLVARDPEISRPSLKVDWRGAILVDIGRNDYSATFAPAYTVRARPGAPVSAPCTWEEVERGESLGVANEASQPETKMQARSASLYKTGQTALYSGRYRFVLPLAL